MSGVVRLAGGRLYDPVNGLDGEVRDLYLVDGRIAWTAPAGRRTDRTWDCRGQVVMAGGIDIHTHIGGGKVNLARLLLPEDHRHHRGGGLPGSGLATPTADRIGTAYARMGYTACFEPAMLPSNARQAQLEMCDIPLLDRGAYVMLGNDEFLLRRIAAGADQREIDDYVAWTVCATQALAVKVVNPGGISAFKFNQRTLDLDERHRAYGVTPRQVLTALAQATRNIGLAHPLHVHGCNLGVPGNIDTTLATVQAVEGLPLHLTHVQFHSYGREGGRGFSSGALALAECVNRTPTLSVDVGQVIFGQTVTASGDTMRQYAGRRHAHPDKWVLMDIECDAGCGVVPFRYRSRSFVHALQWLIGLELFLLIEDPWRVFLTTDHPNGGPFTSYPHLIRLLMDREFRAEQMTRLHPEAVAASVLAGIRREYSLYEVAIVTRAGPARSLGLSTRGHLGNGAVADVTVYRDDADRERMFERPALVFKNGRLVVRDGEVVDDRPGRLLVARPDHDPLIERRIARHHRRYGTLSAGHQRIDDAELEAYGELPPEVQAPAAGAGR